MSAENSVGVGEPGEMDGTVVPKSEFCKCRPLFYSFPEGASVGALGRGGEAGALGPRLRPVPLDHWNWPWIRELRPWDSGAEDETGSWRLTVRVIETAASIDKHRLLIV